MTTQAVSGRRYFTKAWLLEQKSLIALLVLIAIVSTMSPNFFTVNNLFNILQQTSVNAIMAVGMTLVILTSGIDLSVGSILAASAMVAVMVVTIWQALGWTMLFYISALNRIPAALYEASAIDGCSAWTRLWKITLPLISPTTFFLVIVNLITAIESFDQFQILTQGGPSGQTTTMIIDTYQTAIGSKKYGEGAARAVVICIFLSLFCIAYFRVNGNAQPRRAAARPAAARRPASAKSPVKPRPNSVADQQARVHGFALDLVNGGPDPADADFDAVAA